MRPFLLGLALAVLLTGCSTSSGVLAGSGGYVAGDGRSQLVPASERQAAPAVEAETLSGGSLTLADLDGPVVVNFWASWCGPCAKETPALARLAKAYSGRVAFVGVNVKDNAAAARTFEHDFGVPYPSWHDPSSVIAASFGGIGPGALPSTLVLDSEHRVAARFFGAVNEVRLDPVLGSLLDEA